MCIVQAQMRHGKRDGEHAAGATRTERPVLVQGARCGALVGVDQAVIRPLLLCEYACSLQSIQQGAQKAWERLRSAMASQWYSRAGSMCRPVQHGRRTCVSPSRLSHPRELLDPAVLRIPAHLCHCCGARTAAEVQGVAAIGTHPPAAVRQACSLRGVAAAKMQAPYSMLTAFYTSRAGS